MNISLIVAHGKNREIGRDNKLLWHISADLKNFKRVTLNHCIIMGRKTFEAIGRPLPKRKTIVLTRNVKFTAPAEVLVAHSVAQAIEMASGVEQFSKEQLFIVGGGEIYELFAPMATRIFLSEVDYATQADTFFPEIDFSLWNLESQQNYHARPDSYAWSYSIWNR